MYRFLICICALFPFYSQASEGDKNLSSSVGIAAEVNWAGYHGLLYCEQSYLRWRGKVGMLYNFSDGNLNSPVIGGMGQLSYGVGVSARHALYTGLDYRYQSPLKEFNQHLLYYSMSFYSDIKGPFAIVNQLGFGVALENNTSNGQKIKSSALSGMLSIGCILRIAIALLLFSACNDPVPRQDGIKLLGHAGTGLDPVNSWHPPNSWGALRSALEIYGLDGVEVDLQYTKDSVGILYHDQYLEERCNCRGEIAQLTYDQIKDCRYRRHPSLTYPDSLVLYTDFMEYAKSLNAGTSVSIQLKLFGGNVLYSTIARQVALSHADHGDDLDMYFESADTALLHQIKSEGPGAKTLLNSEIGENSGILLANAGVDGIVDFFLNPTPADIKRLSDSGYVVSLYGQKTVSDMENSNVEGVHFLQVDNPVLARRYYQD